MNREYRLAGNLNCIEEQLEALPKCVKGFGKRTLLRYGHQQINTFRDNNCIRPPNGMAKFETKCLVNAARDPAKFKNGKIPNGWPKGRLRYAAFSCFVYCFNISFHEF